MLVAGVVNFIDRGVSFCSQDTEMARAGAPGVTADRNALLTA